MGSIQERKVGSEVERRKPTCVVLGSFRFNRQINEIIEQLDAGGINVLAPERGIVVREELGIKALEGQDDKNALELETNFIRTLTSADCAYIVNPRGYVGINTIDEIEIAVIHGLPVYAMEPIKPRYKTRLTEPLRRAIKTLSPPNFVTMVKDGEMDTDGYVWHRKQRESISPEGALELTKITLYSDFAHRVGWRKGRTTLSPEEQQELEALKQLLVEIPYKWMDYFDSSRWLGILRKLEERQWLEKLRG